MADDKKSGGGTTAGIGFLLVVGAGVAFLVMNGQRTPAPAVTAQVSRAPPWLNCLIEATNTVPSMTVAVSEKLEQPGTFRQKGLTVEEGPGGAYVDVTLAFAHDTKAEKGVMGKATGRISDASCTVSSLKVTDNLGL